MRLLALGLAVFGASALAGDKKAAPPKDTLSTEDFCAAYKAKLGDLKKKCDEKRPQSRTSIQFLELALDDESCAERLQNVTITKSKVKACLDTLEWKSPNLSNLAQLKVCRDAMKGTLKQGDDCNFHFECAANTWCTEKQPLVTACGAPVKPGDACSEMMDVCGATMLCVGKKCTPRAKAGEACQSNVQQCAEGLTCLIDQANAVDGKCGAPRKSGEKCHRWTECVGLCLTPSEDVKDGVCVPECGSK
ncbi:MAG: hypothetical protein U0228_09005 [Myxococcaceae bacterium]